MPYERGTVDTHTHRQEERHMKRKAEIGLVFLQPRMPKIVRKSLKIQGRAWNEFFLRAHRRNEPCQHPDLRVLASRL